MADDYIVTEHNTPFRPTEKAYRQNNEYKENSGSFGRELVKAGLGVALTGDASGAVAGLVVGSVVDKIMK
jgi:hypothetical protein